jgi:hypothetical protein
MLTLPDVVKVQTDPQHGNLAPRRSAYHVVSVALPLVGVLAAFSMGVSKGLATGILVLAAMVLLTAIWQLWSSVQLVAEDDPAKEEHLASAEHSLEEEQKAFLLRAMEDLDFEQSVGKIDEADYQELRQKFLEQARAALGRNDEGLQPFREEAERLIATARAARPDPPGNAHLRETDSNSARFPERVTCRACETPNEKDARFCKRCGARIDGSNAVKGGS